MLSAWLAFRSLPKWTYGLMAAGALVAGFMVWDHFDDKAAVAAAEAKREAKAAPARATASEERLRDAIKQTKDKEQTDAAIRNANDTGAPSPAALALACEQLRKLGRVSTACGPEGGDSGQADPE